MKRGRGLAYGVCGMRQCVMQMESSERQGLTEGLKCWTPLAHEASYLFLSKISTPVRQRLV